jgi:tetratricopeptide (TPR) repeat protein
MAATGEAGEVAAWLAYDADRQDASRQIIQEALLLSRQAGDRDMELFQLAHLAMQSTFLHRPAEALRISDGVLDSVKLAPRVAALFDIRRGRALAQMGDQQRAFAALDKAAGALAEGVSAHDPRWTWWITDAEITWHRGMAYADLGQWRTSVPLFQESFEQRAAYRRAQYNDQAHLLNALAHLHAWHDAEPIVVQLVELAAEVGSARTANLLRRVAKRIGRTEDVPSTVADAAAALT